MSVSRCFIFTDTAICALPEALLFAASTSFRERPSAASAAAAAAARILSPEKKGRWRDESFHEDDAVGIFNFIIFNSFILKISRMQLSLYGNAVPVEMRGAFI